MTTPLSVLSDGDCETTSRTYFSICQIQFHYLKPLHRPCVAIIDYLNVDKSDDQLWDRTELILLRHYDNLMHRCLSLCRLILQGFKSLRKKRRIGAEKKICACIVADQAIKLEIAKRKFRHRSHTSSGTPQQIQGQRRKFKTRKTTMPSHSRDRAAGKRSAVYRSYPFL